MDEPLLPLFPLSLVILPGMSVPLHIFEDRYKDMMAAVVPDKREVGIILAKDDGLVSVGCTAVVQEVVRRYPDGRLDLVATGQRRFEVEQLNDTQSFLQAEVTFFEDDDLATPTTELRRKAIVACQDLLAGEGGSVAGLEMSSARLSFQLGQFISDMDRRQVLISMKSEVERLEFLIRAVPDYLVQRQRIELARRVAPLNGHAKHVVTS